jgi:hypothetical protein
MQAALQHAQLALAAAVLQHTLQLQRQQQQQQQWQL